MLAKVRFVSMSDSMFQVRNMATISLSTPYSKLIPCYGGKTSMFALSPRLSPLRACSLRTRISLQPVCLKLTDTTSYLPFSTWSSTRSVSKKNGREAFILTKAQVVKNENSAISSEKTLRPESIDHIAENQKEVRHKKLDTIKSAKQSSLENVEKSSPKKSKGVRNKNISADSANRIADFAEAAISPGEVKLNGSRGSEGKNCISVPENRESGIQPQTKKRNQPEGKKQKKKSEKNSKANKAVDKISTIHTDVNCKSDKVDGVHSLSLVEGRSVVIVESPAKAKVIEKYLGEMFEVQASYGHVRHIARRNGSVQTDNDFNMLWEVPADAWKRIRAIKQALSGAKNLVLATDPDREGEAIAWHVSELLDEQDLSNKNIVRVAFNEITKPAVVKAMESPRRINTNLVNACLARTALDYLIGFNISPVLWRKLPACLSAGRVQSAALSIICIREKEIRDFDSQQFWTIEANAIPLECSVSDKNFSCLSEVTHVDGKKLEKFSINSEEEAHKVVQKASSKIFKVVDLKRSTMFRNPPFPYITSSLQQDASNKLNFSPAHTMKLAQKLYEGVSVSKTEAVGLITYMRTDGIRISDEAAKDIHSFIKERYGEDFTYDPVNIRVFQKKVQNAQEAHESIRPTDIRRVPSSLVDVLDEESLKLYTFIWCRTMACQMKAAKLDLVTVSFGTDDGYLRLNSGGSTMSFLGHLMVQKDSDVLRIINDGSTRKDEDDKFSFLCNFKVHDVVRIDKFQPLQHSTEPPPRYSEASLVKKLEDLGIGRPSTYATVLRTLQERNYVTLKQKRLFPEFRGQMLSVFLSVYFPDVIDLGFTASIEKKLDDISTGIVDWKDTLKIFWEGLSKDCEKAKTIENSEVVNILEETFQDTLFHGISEDRLCPGCNVGTLRLKVSRHGQGYFVGCSRYPACSYILKTVYSDSKNERTVSSSEQRNHIEPKLLGIDPESQSPVLLKNGPFGYYLQLGEDKKGSKPKRVGLSLVKDIDSINLEQALDMLQYPRLLGKHPETKKPVMLQRARDGLQIRYQHFFSPVPKKVDPTTITLEMALEFLATSSTKRTGRPTRNRKTKSKKSVDKVLQASK